MSDLDKLSDTLIVVMTLTLQFALISFVVAAIIAGWALFIKWALAGFPL